MKKTKINNKYLKNTVFLLSVFLNIWLTVLLVLYPKNQDLPNPTTIPTIQSPTATITPTATPSSTISVTKKPQPKKIALHIDSIDHSEGRPNGLITTGVKVRLYSMDGKLLEEKTPSKYVDNGQVGTGGDTVFYVFPSTYKIVSETEKTTGSCIMIVRSTTEYNSCAIYLTNK